MASGRKKEELKKKGLGTMPEEGREKKDPRRKAWITLENPHADFFKPMFVENEAADSAWLQEFFIPELYNMARMTQRALKIFSYDEAVALMDASNGWMMMFQASAKDLLIFEMEDYFRLNQSKEPPPEMMEKLRSLNEFSAWVLCRTMHACWTLYENEKLFEQMKLLLVK